MKERCKRMGCGRLAVREGYCKPHEIYAPVKLGSVAAHNKREAVLAYLREERHRPFLPAGLKKLVEEMVEAERGGGN